MPARDTAEGRFRVLPVEHVPAAAYGIVRSQIPGHNPAHATLPALAK